MWKAQSFELVLEPADPSRVVLCGPFNECNIFYCGYTSCLSRCRYIEGSPQSIKDTDNIRRTVAPTQSQTGKAIGLRECTGHHDIIRSAHEFNT